MQLSTIIGRESSININNNKLNLVSDREDSQMRNNVAKEVVKISKVVSKEQLQRLFIMTAEYRIADNSRYEIRVQKRKNKKCFTDFAESIW